MVVVPGTMGWGGIEEGKRKWQETHTRTHIQPHELDAFIVYNRHARVKEVEHHPKEPKGTGKNLKMYGTYCIVTICFLPRDFEKEKAKQPSRNTGTNTHTHTHKSIIIIMIVERI